MPDTMIMRRLALGARRSVEGWKAEIGILEVQTGVPSIGVLENPHPRQAFLD